MNSLRTIAFEALWATGFATAFVVLEFDVAVLLLMLWGSILLVLTRRVRGKGEGLTPRARWLTHAAVLFVAYVAAAAAPVKRIEFVKREMVLLSSSEQSLCELSTDCRWERRRHFPLQVHLSISRDSSNEVVRFSSRLITLDEFIRTIESQTQLRHKFLGCGNADSVLFGSAYNFGLNFRDPKRSYLVDDEADCNAEPPLSSDQATER